MHRPDIALKPNRPDIALKPDRPDTALKLDRPDAALKLDRFRRARNLPVRAPEKRCSRKAFFTYVNQNLLHVLHVTLHVIHVTKIYM